MLTEIHFSALRPKKLFQCLSVLHFLIQFILFQPEILTSAKQRKCTEM